MWPISWETGHLWVGQRFGEKIWITVSRSKFQDGQKCAWMFQWARQVAEDKKIEDAE